MFSYGVLVLFPPPRSRIGSGPAPIRGARASVRVAMVLAEAETVTIGLCMP